MAGSHTLNGGAGNNVFDCSSAFNAVVMNLWTQTATQNGFGGTDTLTGTVKTVLTGSGNDTISGGSGGGHTFDGGGGINTLDYSTVSSAVRVDMSAGTATGFGGTDNFTNFQVVKGGSGNDTLTGGSGNDTFIAGAGNNTYSGGTGVNALDYSAATGVVVANLSTGVVQNGFGGTDTVSSFQTVKLGVNDTLVAGTGTETLSASGSGDVLAFGSSISHNQLWFIQSGRDILVDEMGTNNSVKISGGNISAIDAGDAYNIDSQLTQLIQAMANYSADPAHQGFDPTTATTVPNDPTLQTAMVAAWHH